MSTGVALERKFSTRLFVTPYKEMNASLHTCKFKNNMEEIKGSGYDRVT